MTAQDLAETLSDDEPIVATIVPPPPSPWQFGLRSLMGLMAVCGVQFALMRYLSVIGGLVAAMAICFVALAGILISAVLFVPSRTRLMEQLDTIGIRLVVGIAILLVGTILAGGGTGIVYVLGEMQTAWNLEKDFGIRTLRTEVWDGKGTHHGLRVVVVVTGSDADKAGIKMGEVIVVDGTISDFYRRMQENRGKQFSFQVSAPPVGGSIEKIPQRQVSIVVPQ